MPFILVLLVIFMCLLFTKLTWILIPLALFCGFAVVVGLIKRRM
jgi:hypothetical protein